MGISRTKGPLAGGIETPPGLMKVTVQNCKRLDTPIYIDPKTRKQVDPATWGKKPAKVKTAITHDFDLTKTPRVRPVIPRTETEQLLEKVVTDPLPGLKKPKGKTGPLLGSTRPQDTHKDFWDNLFNRGVGRRTKNINVESKIAQLWGKKEANPEWFAKHHKQANSHFKEFENLYKQFMKKGKGGKYLMLGVAAGAGALALLANPEKADASKLSTLRKLQKAVFKPSVIDAAIDTIDKLRPGIAGETLSKINAPKWIKAEQAYTQVAKTVLPKGTKYKNLGPMKNYSEHLKGVKLPEQEVAVFENTVPKEIAQLSNSKFIFSGKDNTLYQSMHNNSVGMHHEEMTSALWHSLDDPSLVRGHILNGKAFLYSPFEGIDKSAWGMNEFGPTRVAVMQKQAERAMDRAKAMLGKAGIAVGGATAAAVGMDTWSPPEATAGVIPPGKMISRLVQATRGLPKKGPASEMMGLLGRWGKKGENFKAKEMEFGLTEWLTAKGDEVVTRQEVIFAATERNALKGLHVKTAWSEQGDARLSRVGYEEYVEEGGGPIANYFQRTIKHDKAPGMVKDNIHFAKKEGDKIVFHQRGTMRDIEGVKSYHLGELQPAKKGRETGSENFEDYWAQNTDMFTDKAWYNVEKRYKDRGQLEELKRYNQAVESVSPTRDDFEAMDNFDDEVLDVAQELAEKMWKQSYVPKEAKKLFPQKFKQEFGMRVAAITSLKDAMDQGMTRISWPTSSAIEGIYAIPQGARKQYDFDVAKLYKNYLKKWNVEIKHGKEYPYRIKISETTNVNSPGITLFEENIGGNISPNREIAIRDARKQRLYNITKDQSNSGEALWVHWNRVKGDGTYEILCNSGTTNAILNKDYKHLSGLRFPTVDSALETAEQAVLLRNNAKNFESMSQSKFQYLDIPKAAVEYFNKHGHTLLTGAGVVAAVAATMDPKDVKASKIPKVPEEVPVKKMEASELKPANNKITTKLQEENKKIFHTVDVPYDLVKERAGFNPEQWDLVRGFLFFKEGSFIYNKFGGAGGHYDGAFQIGRDAKADALRNMPDNGPDRRFFGHSKAERLEYRNSPVMQERVLAGYWISNHKHLMKKCPEEYGGISKDKQMQVLAYAHIVGVGSAVKYLQGGKAVTDKNNISGLHYLKRMEVLQKASKKDRNWFKSIAEIIGPNVAEAATLTEAQRLGELNPKRVAGTKSFDELHSPPNSVTDDDPAALYTLTDSEVAVAQQLGLTPQQTNNLNGVKEHLHGVASMFEGPPKEHPPAQGTLAQGHIKTYWDKFVSDLGAPVLGPVADTVIQTMMIPGKLAQMCLGAATVALGDAVQTGLETAGEVAKERAWDPNDDTFSMAQKREMKKEHLKKFKERDEKGYMAPIDAKVKELFKSQQKSLYHTLDYYNNLLLKGGWQDPMNEKENFNRTVRTALEFVGPGGKAMQITKGRLLLKEAMIAKRVGNVKLAVWLSKRARGIRKGDTTLTMEGTRFMAFSALLSTAEALGGNESVDFYTKVEGGLATALMASRFKAVRSIQKAMGPGFYQFGEKLGGGILKYLKEARFGGKLFKPVTYKEKLWSKDSLKWWGRMYADKTFLAWSMKRTIRNLMTKVGISDKEADGIYQLMYNDLSSTERILVGEYLSQGWWGARSFMDPKTKKRVGHKIFVEAKNLATGTTKGGKNYTRATPTSVEEITMAARAAGVNDKRIKLVTDRVEHIREMVKAAELTATETVGKGNKPLINEMLYRANLDMGIPSRVMKAQLKIFNNPQHGEMMAKMSIQGRLDLTKRVKKLDVAPEMFDGLKLLMQPARYTSNGYRNMMREIQRMQLAASVRQGPHSSKIWTKGKPELVGSPDWGPLSKMYVTPEVAYQLKNLTRETHHLTAWMDKLLGPWKMGKVVLNPATHGRNIITNVILADLGGLSPWNMKPYAMAFKELRKPGKYFKEAGEELMGGTWMGKDLLTSYGPMSGRSLLNWTLQGTGAGVGAWSGMEFGDSQLGGLGAVAGAALGAAGGFKFAKHAGMLYQAEEQLFRLALFIRQRQLGFSVGDARAHALKYLFNYGEIPQGVKAMRTWVMPFATFSYKALPLIAESAVKHPIRLAKWVAAPYAATAMAMQNMDISDQDWQRVKKSLPSYIERGIFTLLAIKDERGRLQFADATYIMPWGDLSELRQRGLIERTIQHPLWVLAADFMRNRNGIDLPIYYEGDTPKVKVLKSLHHIGVMAMPSLTPGIGTNWKLLNDAFHQEKFASTPAQAMSSSYLGIKIKHHEVGKGMAKNRKKLSRQISELKGGLKWKQKRGIARPQDVEYTRDAVRRLRENYREGP